MPKKDCTGPAWEKSDSGKEQKGFGKHREEYSENGEKSSCGCHSKNEGNDSCKGSLKKQKGFGRRKRECSEKGGKSSCDSHDKNDGNDSSKETLEKQKERLEERLSYVNEQLEKISD